MLTGFLNEAEIVPILEAFCHCIGYQARQGEVNRRLGGNIRDGQNGAILMLSTGAIGIFVHEEGTGSPGLGIQPSRRD